MISLTSFKKYATLALFGILFIANQTSFDSAVKSVMLSFGTFIYTILNLPLFRLTNRTVRFMLLMNSIVLIILSLNSSFFEINKQTILLITGLVSMNQITLLYILRGVDFSIEEYQRVEQFCSKIETINYFRTINSLNYITLFMIVSLYNSASFLGIIFVLLFLNICLRVVRGYLLIKAYVSDKLLIRYLGKILIGEFLVVLSLLALLMIVIERTLFINLLVFSNFVVPFLRQKEYLLSKATA